MRRLLIAITLFAITLPAQAALKIEVTEGVTGAIPIAIVPFAVPEGYGPSVDVASVVERDLASTGLFNIVPRNKQLGRPSSAGEVNLKNWRTVGADHLVVGELVPVGEGDFRVRFHLMDVFNDTGGASGYEIDAPAKALRRAAHMVANRIYEQLTGHPGYFTTRIAYVTAKNTTRGPRYDLIIADQDGYNAQTVASSSEPIMSPSWSPDGRHLAYVAFDIEEGLAILQIQDLQTGGITEVSSREGINGAPSWSPDGRFLALTLSYHGNPDVFIYDRSTRDMRQLTRSPAIDTEPSWAPDSRSLIFTSDRGGSAQIYRVPVSGGNAERLTFEGKSNSRAVFSPDGKSIAMVTSSGGYRVAVLDLRTRNLRILTDGPLDESPSFAPNGQALIYTRSGRGGTELATVSIDGRAKTRLHQQGEVREPSWSPLD